MQIWRMKPDGSDQEQVTAAATILVSRDITAHRSRRC
jgi:hypothetical protein